jgi:hypothetical protein
VNHVESGIWAYAVVFILFFTIQDFDIEKRNQRKFLYAALLIGVLGFISTISLYEFNKIYRNSITKSLHSSDWDAFLEYARSNPNNVYLLPFKRYKELGTFVGKTHEAVLPGCLNNIYSTGYWNIHLPPMERELQKRGVNNVFRDIKKSNVYVMNDRESLSLAPFYKDHYHEILIADTIKKFGDLLILKYRSIGEKL